MRAAENRRRRGVNIEWSHQGSSSSFSFHPILYAFIRMSHRSAGGTSPTSWLKEPIRPLSLSFSFQRSQQLFFLSGIKVMSGAVHRRSHNPGPTWLNTERGLSKWSTCVESTPPATYEFVQATRHNRHPVVFADGEPRFAPTADGLIFLRADEDHSECLLSAPLQIKYAYIFVQSLKGMSGHSRGETHLECQCGCFRMMSEPGKVPQLVVLLQVKLLQ